ncbi:MAG: hypothetical protein CMP07_08005 [Xanthomonadales bacterium]|nr:hypothetical protein [Xanthomonadales bacterium]
MPLQANPPSNSMPESFEYSVRASYRLLDRDWIDGLELRTEPSPSRLRAACLLIYAGLLLSLGAALTSSPAAASASNYLVAQNWGVADGLEQHTVQAIARDSRGFVWVGTLDGLSRFDGRRFRNFRLMDYPEMGTNRIAALAATPDGALWIGTESRGVVRYRDGAFQAVPICGQRCRVLTFSHDPGGRLWLLSPRQILRFDPETLQVDVRLELEQESEQPNGLYVLDDGRLVYFSGDTVFVRQPEEPAAEPMRIRAPGRVVGVASVEGRLLVATAASLLQWDGYRLVPSELEPDDVSSTAQRIVGFWPGQANQVIMQLGDGSIHWRAGHFSRRVEMGPRPRLLSIMTDDDGALWLGSRFEGIFRVSPARMFRAAGYRNAELGSVLPIIDHPDQGVLVGRLCGGVEHVLDDGRSRPLFEPEAGPTACTWTMLAEPGGGVLIASASGRIRRWTNAGTIDIEPGSDDGGHLGANFLFRDRSGTTWLGADNGLFRIEDGRIGPAVNEVEASPLLAAVDAPNDGLLIGTDQGLARFESSEYRAIRTGEWIDGLSVRSIFRQDDRTLWFGTYGGGLWRLKDGRWFQVGPDRGLAEDVVSCMLSGPSGRLWMSGNHGVSLASLADLNALADGSIERVNAWSLTDVDGMPASETNGGGQPACHRDRRGWFWFPTVRGPVAFDPASISRFEPAGRLFIESVSVAGQRLEPNERVVELPTDARDLEIRYSAPQFENAQRLRFRYRLAGADEQWIEADGSQIARYPVVPVGRYRFEVQLGVDDGRWLNSMRSMELVVPEPGFQIRPRQLILVIAALLVVLLVFRWRISELRQRDVELNRIIDERTHELKKMNSRLDELSRTDELTGIANHRRLRFYMGEQWRACRAAGLPLTAIIIDVDKFKDFNDSHGHQVGDSFLRAMAQSLARLVAAEGGLLARYGGEEFIAVLPRRTLSEGRDIAESLRQAVISLEFRQGSDSNGFVTASFGVASVMPDKDATPEDLVRRADQAMYQAKRGGRDRVCVDRASPTRA